MSARPCVTSEFLEWLDRHFTLIMTN